MKYWVYKESRILGPFDKEAVSGLPGLDSETLVCAGDSAEGSWMPAGELEGLTGISAGGSDGLLDDLPSSIGLLDQLQIDSAELIGDDDFCGALAENLFQDAVFKKGFKDILAERVAPDESEARRAREKISELTAQIETLYRHVSELEAGQTDLARRLALKDIELRSRGNDPAAGTVGGSVGVGTGAAAKIALSPALPPIPDVPPTVTAMQVPPAVELLRKAFSFGTQKSFKIVSTIKSFKVVGADEVMPSASPNPGPQFQAEPIIASAAPAPVAAPAVLALIAPPPSLPPPPAPPLPHTLSRSQSVPALTSGDLLGSFDAVMQAPPATPARAIDASGPVDEVLAARFAKSEPAPPTGKIEKPGRSNKAFLIAGVLLVILLVIVGILFVSQPKDLKQMTTLDDGKAPIGVSSDDGTVAPPPIVKPKIAEPPPAGPSTEHAAAIEVVKEFPLDGVRGTVGRWLQYSYTADPNAGSEEWSASTTGDNTVLVEYRLIPGASGGKAAFYLFEVDPSGIVMGKNIEARQMLAGGPPPAAPKAKKRPAKKAASKRRPVRKTPKAVPLLPLPDSGELRPPVKDEGSFGLGANP